MTDHEEHTDEQDFSKVMKDLLLLCKHHRPDLNQIFAFEQTYKNTIINYLKNLFYSKETRDLQVLLDELRKVIVERQEKTFFLLDEVQSHAFGISALKPLKELCKKDKHINQKIYDLTFRLIQEFIVCVTKETKKKTLTVKGKYMSLKEVVMEIEHVTEVHIVAERCLRVDAGLTLPGINLVVMSPDINIMCPISWNVSTY